MNFNQFVKTLPEGLVYAPIYAKGHPDAFGQASDWQEPSRGQL